MKRAELNRELPEIVSGIVSSIIEDGNLQHLNNVSLPSRDAIVQIIEMSRQLLFPGYFGKQGLNHQNITYRVGELVMELSDLLFEQVRCCLRYREGVPCDQTTGQPLTAAPANGELTGGEDADGSSSNGNHAGEVGLGLQIAKAQTGNCDGAATEIVRAYLLQLPDIRRVLAHDVQAAFDGDPAAQNTDETIYCYPGLIAISVQRLAHELYKLNVPLLPRIMTEYAHSLTGIDIHPGAELGERFFIDHGTAVVIGETTRIGRNVTVYQGVTLGALSPAFGQRLRGQKRHPTIEDNVTIYAGATILGGDTIIGHDSVIGGNVFITSSVPPLNQVSAEPPLLKYRDRSRKKRGEVVLDFQI